VQKYCEGNVEKLPKGIEKYEIKKWKSITFSEEM